MYAKHDIAAFNRLKAQGGAQATNAVARFERTAEKMAWLPAPAGGAAEEKARGITLADYGPTWIEQRTKGGQPLVKSRDVVYDVVV